MLGFILRDKSLVPTPSSSGRRTVFLDAADGTLKVMDNNRVCYALGGLGSMIVKSATETKTADTAYADDDELLFAVAANTDYLFQGRIMFETNATPDFKIQIAVPSTPTLFLMKQQAVAPGATAYSNIEVQTATTSSAILGGTGNGFFEFSGILRNGANAGNLSVQWAQNTSNGANTKVLVGSTLEFRQISGYGLSGP
jgi:hypothetical protein